MNKNETKNAAQNLFNLLRLFHSKIFRPFELALKSDISPMQFRTLGLLSERKSMTMTELANEILISKQQLTPMIDKLIDSNIVVRENDKEDRRIIKISLTPSGKELLRTRNDELLELLGKKFEHLDQEDIEKLEVALNQVYGIIMKMD